MTLYWIRWNFCMRNKVTDMYNILWYENKDVCIFQWMILIWKYLFSRFEPEVIMENVRKCVYLSTFLLFLHWLPLYQQSYHIKKGNQKHSSLCQHVFDFENVEIVHIKKSQDSWDVVYESCILKFVTSQQENVDVTSSYKYILNWYAPTFSVHCF